MGCKNSERVFFLFFLLVRFLVELFLNKTHGFDLGNLEIVHFFVSSLGNGPWIFFLKLQLYALDWCKKIMMLFQKLFYPMVTFAPLIPTLYTPWLQNWPISHQHRSDNFDLHKSFALKCTWLFSRLQSLFVLKLLYLLLSALFLCLWINCSIL